MSLGVITRNFERSDTMQAVYDWVGSLCTLPKHFSLSSIFPKQAIYPDELVADYASVVLMMSEEDQPLPLSIEDDVVVISNGSGTASLDDTLDFNIPDVLLEADAPLSSAETTTAHHFNTLNDNRQKVLVDLKSSESIKVNKETLVSDMLLLYKDPALVEKSLLVDLASSSDIAMGDGVIKELFSLFWEKFLVHCGDSNQVCLPLGPNPDDYIALGRILHHGYILTGFFPTRLAKACVHQALFNDVSKECIIASFTESLPQRQKELVRQVMQDNESGDFPLNDICDILEDYGNTRLPKRENINSIIHEIGAVEFVAKPFLYLQKMRQGMGLFWNNVTPEQVDAIYEMCKPTASRVIDALLLEPQGKKEDKISRWLRLYLRECSEKGLRRFLWFCTGTDLIVPDRRIKVCFEFMPEVMQRPRAKTCFNILTLPSSYASYAHLRSNLDMYLDDLKSWDMCD